MPDINHTPPQNLTVQQRREEVALLLARGLVRLRERSFDQSTMPCKQRAVLLGFSGEQSVHANTVNNPTELQ